MKKNLFQNLESIKLVEDELRDKLTATERKLAEAENREDQLQRASAELNEKYEQTLTQIQKLKEDLDDARHEAENVANQIYLFFCKRKLFESFENQKFFFLTISGNTKMEN